MGAWMRSMAHLWACFLWITRGKLWINDPNWGKLVRLFEYRAFMSPPYLGVPLLTLPYAETARGMQKMIHLLEFCPQLAWG